MKKFKIIFLLFNFAIVFLSQHQAEAQLKISSSVIGNGLITSVKQFSNSVPKEFLLEQNYPNPFNPTIYKRLVGKGTDKLKKIKYSALPQRVMRLGAAAIQI